MRGGRGGAVVLGMVLLVGGCSQTVSGTAVRPAATATSGVPLLSERHVEEVLLPVAELNRIVGSTAMIVTSDLDQMTDHSGDVSDPACVGAIYGAEAPAYAGSGWTAVRDQVVREPGDNNQHWLEQTAVLYSSEEQARAQVESARNMWDSCSALDVTVNDGVVQSVWRLAPTVVDGPLVTQMSVQQDTGGWGCQHAMSALSNLSVEAWACGFGSADEAATIATEMVAKAAEVPR